MLSRVAKLLLVSTSLAPILVTWAFVDWRARGFTATTVAAVGTATGFTALCGLLIVAAKRNLPRISFHCSNAKPADTELVGFVLAYLLPVFAAATDQSDIAVIAFIVGIIFVIVWSTHAYHFNPLLALFGFHFYEVTNTDGVTFMLITRRDLLKTKDITHVVQLTNYIILERG